MAWFKIFVNKNAIKLTFPHNWENYFSGEFYGESGLIFREFWKIFSRSTADLRHGLGQGGRLLRRPRSQAVRLRPPLRRRGLHQGHKAENMVGVPISALSCIQRDPAGYRQSCMFTVRLGIATRLKWDEQGPCMSQKVAKLAVRTTSDLFIKPRGSKKNCHVRLNTFHYFSASFATF